MRAPASESQVSSLMWSQQVRFKSGLPAARTTMLNGQKRPSTTERSTPRLLTALSCRWGHKTTQAAHTSVLRQVHASWRQPERKRPALPQCFRPAPSPRCLRGLHSWCCWTCRPVASRRNWRTTGSSGSCRGKCTRTLGLCSQSERAHTPGAISADQSVNPAN